MAGLRSRGDTGELTMCGIWKGGGELPLCAGA